MSVDLEWDVSQRVRSMLDLAARQAPPQYSLDLCQQFEEQLPHLLKTEMISVIRGAKSRHRSLMMVGNEGMFILNGAAYELRIVRSPHDCTNLDVVLVGIWPPAPLLVPPVEIFIESRIGRVQKVTLRVASIFEKQLDVLAEAIRAVLESSYRWLSVYGCDQLLAKSQGPNEAYEHIRKLIPERACKLIRLNAIVEGHGIYLLDPFVYEGALESASQGTPNYSRSPVEACADVFTTYVDLEKMFSKEVLREGRTLPADLMRARYASQGVNLSEALIFGTNRIFVQPLVHSDRLSLVAGYPVNLRGEVESELSRSRPDFHNIVNRQSKSLHSTLARLEGPSTSGQSLRHSVAEFLGVLTAAAASHIAKHPF